jgi:hypothetical protein
MSQPKVQEILNSSSANSANGSVDHRALGNWNPETQLGAIKISPQFLSVEEISKLWSVLQVKYRLSMTYQVSAVIMNGR